MRLILFMALMLVSTISASASIEEAIQNYANKHHEIAFSQFEKLASYGSTAAQFNLGAMYARGEATEKDYKKAYHYIYMASLSGQEGAEKTLKFIAESLDDSQIIEVQKLAAKEFESIRDNLIPSTVQENGDAVAVTDLLLTRGVKPEFPRIMAKRGDNGQVDVTFYIDPHGFSRHHKILESSHKYFSAAAIDAARKTIYQPAKIDNTPVTVSEAFFRYKFRMAGKTELDEQKLNELLDEIKPKPGQVNSMQEMTYARTLSAINSFYSKDLKKKNISLDNPNDWFLKSAQNGNAFASYYLGRNVVTGNQCIVEADKGLFWLEKSVEAGVQEGYVLLGLELIYGRALEPDVTRGFELLEKAANNGSTHAQIELARMYAAHPDPKLRDKAKAVKYMEMIKDDYADELSVFEARAVAFAADGQFKQALRWQKKAIKEAKSLDLPLDSFEQDLAIYESSKVPVYRF